jgi:hypothetical protein
MDGDSIVLVTSVSGTLLYSEVVSRTSACSVDSTVDDELNPREMPVVSASSAAMRHTPQRTGSSDCGALHGSECVCVRVGVRERVR